MRPPRRFRDFEDLARDIVLEVGRVDIWQPEPAEAGWPEDAVFDSAVYWSQRFVGRRGYGPVPQLRQLRLARRRVCAGAGAGLYVTRVNTTLERYGDGWETKPEFALSRSGNRRPARRGRGREKWCGRGCRLRLRRRPSAAAGGLLRGARPARRERSPNRPAAHRERPVRLRPHRRATRRTRPAML